MKKQLLIFVLFFALFLVQCKKDKDFTPQKIIEPVTHPIEQPIDINIVKLESVDSCILFPIGNLMAEGSLVDVLIDNKFSSYNIFDDGLGGFWAAVPISAFEDNKTSELRLRITKKYTQFQASELKNDTTQAYLKNSDFINWKGTSIESVAINLYDDTKTQSENALVFQRYTMDYLTFNDTYANYYGGFTALRTYIDQKGVCINFSRLFIALCRAAGIPSRSVSGVIFLDGSVGTDCFFHHQWCEFLDENNKWRSLDLTFTSNVDISDIRYIGFNYCSEETEIFRDYQANFFSDPGKPFRTQNECVLFYSYLPTERGARFGFELINKSGAIVFEKKISIQKSNNRIVL